MLSNHTSNNAGQRRQLRKALLHARESLSQDAQLKATTSVIHQLTKIPAFKKAQHIGLYWASKGELSVAGLFRQTSKHWYLPIISESICRWESRHLRFARYTPSTPITPNRYGIPEPVTKEMIPAMSLDLLLMPLVGFNRRGDRLGMGGGYYDRTLARCRYKKPVLIGLAHSCQESDALEARAWDVPMDAIVTEREIIQFKGRGLVPQR